MVTKSVKEVIIIRGLITVSELTQNVIWIKCITVVHYMHIKIYHNKKI